MSNMLLCPSRGTTAVSLLQAVTVLVTMASEKIIWRLNLRAGRQFATGAVEKADCSSTSFFFQYNH